MALKNITGDRHRTEAKVSMSVSFNRFMLVVCCASCNGSGDGSSASQSTSGTTSSSTSAAASSSGQMMTSSGTSSPTTSMSNGTGESQCGDGTVQDEEACDDGNAINGDGCNVDCVPSGAEIWRYQSNAAGHDRIFGVALGPDGTIFVGGEQDAGGNDKWLAQFSASDGGIIWSEHYDHGGTEAIVDVAVTSAMIYAAGVTNGGSDDLDIWVAGLDLAGKVSWQDNFSSGFGPDYATAVAALPDGDAVVAGLLTPESQVGGVLWLRRYSAAGVPGWTTTRPDVARPLWPSGPGIGVNSERAVVGYSHRISADLQPEMLIAYPFSGDPPLWTLDLTETSGYTFAVTHAPDGDLVIAGRRNYMDLVVRRLSPDGNDVKWESIECTGEGGRAVAVDGQGDVVVIGDGDGANGENIRLCKFSAEGELRWAKDIDGGFGDDRGSDLVIAANDYIVAGGWVSADNDEFDAWLARYSP